MRFASKTFRHSAICFAVLCSLLLSLDLAAVLKTGPPTRVLIDPGHGGADSGTSHGGIREADLVLQFAQRLRERLANDSRFAVAMTRETDNKLSLVDRVRRAEVHQADVLVSLHMNSSSDTRAQGPEFYFQSQLLADDEALFLAAIENQKETLAMPQMPTQALSRKNDLAMILEDLKLNSKMKRSFRLARIISKNWPLANQRSTKSIRQGPFYVINNAPGASVLLELGYLSHSNDRQLLSQSSIQSNLAAELHQSLIEFHEHNR